MTATETDMQSDPEYWCLVAGNMRWERDEARMETNLLARKLLGITPDSNTQTAEEVERTDAAIEAVVEKALRYHR